MRRTESFTERRRAQLARRVAALEAMESRSMISESLGSLGLGASTPRAAVAVGPYSTAQAIHAAAARRGAPVRPLGHAAGQAAHRLRAAGHGGAGFAPTHALPITPAHRHAAHAAGDWLTLAGRPGPAVHAARPHRAALGTPPRHPQAGGAALPRGTGALTGGRPHGVIEPLRLPPPSPAGTGLAAPALLAGLGMLQPPRPGAAPAPVAPHSPSGGLSAGGPIAVRGTPSSGGTTTAADPGLLTVGGSSSSVAQGSFPYFPLYCLSYNDGTVLFPGAVQFANPGGNVDLRAQVRDATGVSYSWSISGDATNLSATNTAQFTFEWNLSHPTADTPTVTLTVTNGSNQSETQTYTFDFPASSTSGSGGYGTATWPTSTSPDLLLSDAPAFASHNASVDANTGALDTAIDLPASNPNVPPLALTYDSLTADPRPIVTAPHAIAGSPSWTSAALTFNGTVGTTYYYSTSEFLPGDIQQVAQQAVATTLATGRYGYSLALQDSGGSTTTVSGTATVLNASNNTNGTDAFGSGWTVAGLERITTATGGVILDLGSGGRSLWFASAGSGGGYTTPAGDFSTLAASSGGGSTRTLKDGTQITFDSSGRETATIDRNGLHTTYGYTGGLLTTITDPYNNLTTLTYSGSLLQSITDPAGRITTFTHSGGSGGANLTGVTLPDSSSWGYAYDSAGRLTQITDPNSKVTTVVYDSAQRVGTITRPDSTSETFTAYEERGWTNTGTQASPTSPVLLAEARGTHADPLGHTTDLRSDWRGMGLTNQPTDPLGNVATADRDANGLATVMIDRINRVTTLAYDYTNGVTKGNVTQRTYPDLNVEQYTYNGDSQVTSHTDPLSHITTYTYSTDGKSNLLSITQPPPATGQASPVTNFTYTPTGRVATIQDPDGNTTSFAYDAQDRLTTITYPGTGTPTQLFAYDSKGNATTVTDERGNVTTYRFDALNRNTGMTDPLGDITTYVYDSGGNRTVDQEPTPTGLTPARTTTYAYDALNRVTTVTAPLARVTVYGYDAAGRQTTATDPMGRITTVSYDADDRATTVTTPLSGTQTRTATSAYDAEGQRVGVTDPLGRVTTYTYTSRGWVATKQDPIRTITYTYTATGKPGSESDPAVSGGYVAQYAYDNLDRLTTLVLDPGTSPAHLNLTTTYAYDAAGNQTGQTDPNGHATATAYDARNRVTTITDALGHATVYGYDSGGNRITVKDPNGHVTSYGYDARDRVVSMTDARGDVTSLVYDSGGRQTAVIDPNGNRTTFAYDAADRLTTTTAPVYLSGAATTATTTAVFDADDELTDTTDGAGRRTTYAYDSGGRRTGETWVGASPAEILTYTYDADDELTGASDAAATLTFGYDSGGRQTSAATSGPGAGQPAVTLSSGYDADGDRTSLADGLSGTGGAGPGLTTYAYDTAKRLTTITRSLGGAAGPQVVYGDDSGGRVTSLARTIGGTGTAVNTTLSYDNADRLTTITHQVGGGTALATYVYGYDSGGRVTSEANAEGTVTYAYDNANELTAAGGSRTESYGYDSGGNRNTAGYAAPANGGNMLTAAPGSTYTYDAAGNLTGKTETGTGNTWTFAWDYRNRLTGVTEKNSSNAVIMQATYTYDALNRRIGTNVDPDGSGPQAPVQSWFVYDGLNPYGDFNGSGAVQKRYLYGPAIDALLARTDSGGASAWYLADKLGTVRDVASTSGSIIDHVVYDSYGKVTSETSTTNGDRFKYAGREYDAATGLYFNRARYFDPQTGRFISQDPIKFDAGDANLYRYVNNSPVNAIDPTGHYPDPQMGTNQQKPGLPASLPPPDPDAMKKITSQQLKEYAEIYQKHLDNERELAKDSLEAAQKLKDFYKLTVKFKLGPIEAESLLATMGREALAKWFKLAEQQTIEAMVAMWKWHVAEVEKLNHYIIQIRAQQIKTMVEATLPPLPGASK